MDSQGMQSGASSRKGWVRWAFAGIFALILLAVFVVPIFFLGWYGFSGTWPYNGRPFFFFPFGFFAFILIFFVGFRLLFRGWGRWRGGYYGGYGYSHDGSLEILNQRYARGEITKEQYDQMKRDIKQQP